MGQSRPGKLGTAAGICPICSKSTLFAYRPFCSRRCATVDLSRWLRGSYAIPVLEDEDEDGAAASASTSVMGQSQGGARDLEDDFE